LISGVDIMPTLLGLIGADIPATVQGTDLSRAVLGLEDRGTESVLLQYEYLFYGEVKEETTFRTFIQGEWHYTYFLTAGPSQLFNVKEDPYQMNNRIHDPLYKTVQADMHAGLAAKLEELGDDFLYRRLHL
jgi:arylsulfatase A-like enzyme